MTHRRLPILARRWRQLALAAVLLVLSGAVVLVWMRIDAADQRASQLASEADRRGDAVSTLAGDVRVLRAQITAKGGTPAAPDPARAVENLPDRARVPSLYLDRRGLPDPQVNKGSQHQQSPHRRACRGLLAPLAPTPTVPGLQGPQATPVLQATRAQPVHRASKGPRVRRGRRETRVTPGPTAHRVLPATLFSSPRAILMRWCADVTQWMATTIRRTSLKLPRWIPSDASTLRTLLQKSAAPPKVDTRSTVMRTPPVSPRPSIAPFLEPDLPPWTDDEDE